jgi:hypothetical protein
MKEMHRRTLVFAFLGGAVRLAGGEKPALRGRLVQKPGKKAFLETADRGLIALEGDQETSGVINDPRLAGAELEITGRFTAESRFAIDPYTSKHSVFLHKGGKTYTISYWCEVCAIRTYSPGKCMCCQEETELDLQEVQP